jgi:5-methylcytosine-specific restriction endonuclease McrA
MQESDSSIVSSSSTVGYSRKGTLFFCWVAVFASGYLNLSMFDGALEALTHSLLAILFADGFLFLLIIVLKRVVLLNDRLLIWTVQGAFILFLGLEITLVAPFGIEGLSHSEMASHFPLFILQCSAIMACIAMITPFWLFVWFLADPSVLSAEAKYLSKKMLLSVEFVWDLLKERDALGKQNERLLQSNSQQEKKIFALQLVHAPPENVAELIQQNRCVLCRNAPISNQKHSICRECKRQYKSYVAQIDYQRTRARLAGLEASLTLYQWLRKLEQCGGLCLLCHEQPAQVIEHYTPIKSKGPTTDDNCWPACHKCNGKKGAKNLDPDV